MDNKRLIIILSVWTVIFTLMGGTLAYFNWQSADNRKTNVTFTVNRNYTCGADSGGHITSNDVRLAPAKCTDPVYAIKRPITTSVTTTGDKVVSMDLWLNINNISTNLTNTSNFKWVIGKNGNSCESGIIKQGDFRNIQDNKINLLDGVEYATLDDIYYLYIWLDEAGTSTNTMNQSFDFSISGYCEDNGLEKATMINFTYYNRNSYFKEENYKTKITDIYFTYDEDLPNDIYENNIKTYTLGSSTTKPITGYLIENTDEGAAENTYKLYISSEYRIFSQNLRDVFRDMTALKNISFNNLDTSLTTNMMGMFYGCSSLTALDLSSFNTSKVTGMGGNGGEWGAPMFGDCVNLISLDLGYFNTLKVTNMSSMFSGCTKLVQLDVSSFNTSKVTNMSNMFKNCNSLKKIDVDYFDTSNVTDMGSMFYGCWSLSKLDVTNFNTSNVTSISWMFYICSGLTELDLTSFNISKVTGGSYDFMRMFSGCTKLRTIYVSEL